MTRAERQLRSTAIHEAGHAVAAIVTGQRFRHVSIIADDVRGSLGHVRLTPWRGEVTPNRALPRMVCAMAGYLAEREFGFRPNREGDEQDRAAAGDLALRLGGDGKEASLWLRIAHGRAANIVHGWRDSINALALALEQSRIIEAEDAKKIVLDTRMRELQNRRRAADFASV